MLLVHAHPDDECIGNAATMARYVEEGAAVTLVTCTLGEEGEILVDELLHLGADAEDELGQHRLGELKTAMDVLGVTDFLQLGGVGRFRDSGMAYDDKGQAIARDVLRDGIFWTTDLLEAAVELVPVIRDRRPQVLITYNELGGYGHPDHIQAHRVAMYAAQLAGAQGFRPDLGPVWTVERILWNTMSRRKLSEGIRKLRAAGDTETFKGFDPDGGPAADDLRRRGHRSGDRRLALGGSEAGRHARPRLPDPSGRSVLRRRRDLGRGHVVARVLPLRVRRAVPRRRLGGRPVRRAELGRDPGFGGVPPPDDG